MGVLCVSSGSPGTPSADQIGFEQRSVGLCLPSAVIIKAWPTTAQPIANL